MQNLPSNISPEKLGRRLQVIFEERRVTQPEIERNTGVNQSQISRIFNGKFMRVEGKNVIKLCKYANLKINKSLLGGSDPRESEVLINALRDIWDGSQQKERALARLIRSLGPLVNK